MAKSKFQIGDRVYNHGRIFVSANQGKHGTVVDYDRNVGEYAIVYDDNTTGVGKAKHYDAAPLTRATKGHSADAVKRAKKELAVKGMFSSLGSSNVTISGSGTLSAQTINKMMAQITQTQIMANGNYYSSSSGGGSSSSGFNTNNVFYFAHPDHPPQALVSGMPVVLLSGKGIADPSKESNPIWKDTGMRGTVRHVTDKGNGEIEAHIEWANNYGNIYTVNNGSCQLQFAPWAPPYQAKPKFTLSPEAFDKLVLEASVKKEIMAVLKQYEHRDKLFNEWGLGETIEYGRGMTMMFWGGPGTGKTFGAHCIAKALGQELLVISAAEVQSSEPGATERNIQQAFTSATEENKVLFLDECDSLITTRADLGMVLAAQVNCLLTAIEKFEGVCILATNRIETMDEALERRIALIVEFPFPKYAQRTEIWKKMLPSKLPLADGITPEVLAQPKFTGGQIKNIILQAARLAVSDASPKVEQAHFDSAIERLKKSKGIMGKLERSPHGRPRQDMQVGVSSNPQVEMDVDTTVSLGDFLGTDTDEEQN